MRLLIASHWHDDHVRGFSEILEKCENAKVCMGQALTKKEFQVFVSHFNKSHPNDKFTSGTKELYKVLQILESRSARGIIAHPDRRLWQNTPSSEDDPLIEVWSLSPSDACSERFLKFVTAAMPGQGETKFRAPSIKENETAIAVLIKYGDTGVLLGADLEETHQGWTAILGSSGRPNIQSNLFKIPHHGSLNGHHDEVWSKMLIKNPTALLTPYNKGHKLPKDTDLDRIRGLTESAFTTQVLKRTPKHSRPQGVEKMIRSISKNITPITKQMGHIHAKLCPEFTQWSIELNDGAVSVHT